SRHGEVQLPLAIASTSGWSPMAPLYVNAPRAPGEAPLVAPSVVAGSPRWSTPGYTVLKTFGNSVPSLPAAMSASPDKGPKENMYVCVPSPIVEEPSPPPSCWHLIAPFTGVDDGTTHTLPPTAATIWSRKVNVDFDYLLSHSAAQALQALKISNDNDASMTDHQVLPFPFRKLTVHRVRVHSGHLS